MARYDVFSLPGNDGYVLDIQTDLLDEMNTRVVVPMLSFQDAPKPAGRLNPVLEINGKSYVMATQFIASIPCSLLSHSVTNLSTESDNIANALDMIFHGF